MCSSMSISAKKCDFPEPLPPKAPLYRDGCSSGIAHFGVLISSDEFFFAPLIDNDSPHLGNRDGVVNIT